MNFFLKKSTKTEGIVALPALLMIGVVIVEIAIAGAALTYVSINSLLSAKASTEAAFVARSGAQDGLIRLVTNKNFTSCSYTLTIGSNSTTIAVQADTPLTGQSTVTAKSSVSGRTKIFQVVANVATTTGLIEVVSFKEATSFPC